MNCKLNVIAKDKKTGLIEEYTFSQTNHCIIRASQRAITNDKLKLVLIYGEPYYKQGLIYYVLGQSSIPKEHKKVTIYWDVAGNEENAEFFIENAMFRALKFSGCGELFFCNYLRYVYPSSFNTSYINLIKQNNRRLKIYVLYKKV